MQRERGRDNRQAPWRLIYRNHIVFVCVLLSCIDPCMYIYTHTYIYVCIYIYIREPTAVGGAQINRV